MEQGKSPVSSTTQAVTGHVFATTHWSVVIAAARSDAAQSAAALEELCRTYWYPIYGHVRRTGRPHAEAQDLTQEFFLRLISRNDLGQADRERGRFRSYLLGALRHFLADEWDKASAAKRGGAFNFVPLDEAALEQKCSAEPAGISDPEKLFDRRWALTLLDRVVQRLHDEYAAAGKGPVFAVLQPCLMKAKQDISHSAPARSLGMTEGAVRVALHRMRHRYGEIFREEIALTVDRPEDINGEIRHLFSALAE